MMIYKMRKTGENNFNSVSDDGLIGLIGSTLVYANGTTNFAVLNEVYTSTDGGENITSHGSAPWSARNASYLFQEENALVMVMGNDMDGVAALDAWRITLSGGVPQYSQIAGVMTGVTASCTGAAFAQHGSERFIIGGNNQTDVKVTTDYINYTSRLTLPADLQNMGGLSCGTFGDYHWIATSQTNEDPLTYPGNLYRFSLDFSSYELVFSDDPLFKGKWPTFMPTRYALFRIRGHNSETGGNTHGVWYSATPADRSSWKQLIYSAPASHATPATSDGEKIYTFCGNMRNDSWIIERIDI